MQKSNVDFYPVLLLSILADTLLRLHTGYWARAGLLALPASAAVLAAVLLLVSSSWQGNALLQKVLCVLLAISSALEILRLHALFGSVYPGTLGLAGTCFVVLAPVIYLRLIYACFASVRYCMLFSSTGHLPPAGARPAPDGQRLVGVRCRVYGNHGILGRAAPACTQPACGTADRAGLAGGVCFSAGAPAGISAVCPLASAARPALPQGSNICRVSTGL